MNPAFITVSSFIEAVNDQDWDRLRDLVIPTFRRYSRAGGDIYGVDSLVEFLKQEFVSFPDARERCMHQFADGNIVTAIMEFSGTQNGAMGEFGPSGIFVSAPYIAVYRVEEGRIVEGWAEWDNLSTLRSLGHIK
jgi:predicted ester cyclase